MDTADVKTFVKNVRKYVHLIEGEDGLSAHDLLFRSAVYLSQIYSLGMILPDIEPSSEELDTYDDPSVMGPLLANIGKYDNYSEIFDRIFESDLVIGSISDDLADIYADLKGPLLSFDQGRDENNPD